MSPAELAEYFAVKQCAAKLYLECFDMAKQRAMFNTPEVRRDAVAINQMLDRELFKEEVDYAVNTLGLAPSEAKHGHMVKECGWLSCSWVYKNSGIKTDEDDD